jgi:hypothetical protein
MRAVLLKLLSLLYRQARSSSYFRSLYYSVVNSSWSMPLFRVEAREVHPGDRVHFHLEMEDLSDPETYTWSLEVERDTTVRKGTDPA